MAELAQNKEWLEKIERVSEPWAEPGSSICRPRGIGPLHDAPFLPKPKEAPDSRYSHIKYGYLISTFMVILINHH